MKTAQQQADEALRNGTISQDQYDALQREIVETEQRLRSLEEQANQSATALQKIGEPVRSCRQLETRFLLLGRSCFL